MWIGRLQKLNQNMNYVDRKTSVGQRFFITFENRNWTTLIMILYYGMGLIGPVPPRNVTSNLTSFCRTYFKAQLIFPPPIHILILFSID